MIGGCVMRKIVLNAGDIEVSHEPAVFETMLGSCVSVCIWDERTNTAGMNHYMLPVLPGDAQRPEISGPEAINLLIDKFLAMGSNIRNLTARIFGGGNVVEALSGNDIGKENVLVARKMLAYYRIPVVGEYTCNNFGIKVVFFSETGKVFVKKLEGGASAGAVRTNRRPG